MGPNADLSKHDGVCTGNVIEIEFCDASCNLVLFGPIKGREKPLLIANWRQKTTMPSEIARTAILN